MQLDATMAATLGPAAANVDLIKAAILGIVEGLTEFLPVSSTGHLLLMEHLFCWGDDAFGKSFAVLIQLGAILALLTIYFAGSGHSPRKCSRSGKRLDLSSVCCWRSCRGCGRRARVSHHQGLSIRCTHVRVAHYRRFRPAVGRSYEFAGALPRSDRLSSADVFGIESSSASP